MDLRRRHPVPQRPQAHHTPRRVRGRVVRRDGAAALPGGTSAGLRRRPARDRGRLPHQVAQEHGVPPQAHHLRPLPHLRALRVDTRLRQAAPGGARPRPHRRLHPPAARSRPRTPGRLPLPRHALQRPGHRRAHPPPPLQRRPAPPHAQAPSRRTRPLDRGTGRRLPESLPRRRPRLRRPLRSHHRHRPAQRRGTRPPAPMRPARRPRHVHPPHPLRDRQPRTRPDRTEDEEEPQLGTPVRPRRRSA